MLLESGLYHGAYYLGGYAVECAIKACICKQARRYDFPDKDFAKDVFSHDLEKLMGLAGLKRELEQQKTSSKDFGVKWALVANWNESTRYETAVSKILARDFYAACTARQSGVLPWIRKRW